MDRKEEDDDDGNVSRMAGYLEKKGKSRLVSLWHRYWFVLEGQRLAYYESQPFPPVDATSPPKGSFTITPSTSVTASISSHSSSGVYSSHHLGYHEIYILTPLQMITLRTKDFDEHRLWMLALLRCKSLPVKEKVKRETSKKSHRNTSYSLTNLTTIEEKNNAWPMKSSHTMDNRNPNVSKVKSESAGNIIDRYITDDQSPSMDEEMSSEEDEAEDTFDKTSSIRSDEDADLSHSPEHHSAILHHEHSLKVMNEEEKRKFRLKSDKRLDEGKSLNVGFSVDVGSRLMRHTVAESNSAEYDVTKISEAKHFQARERKMKSRKFFGMKESKRHDVPTSCQKVFKKCKELEMTHKPNIIPQPLLKNKEKQKPKSEQAVKKVPKDDNAFKEDTVGHEGSEFMCDSKYASEQSESILAPRPSLQSMANNKGVKSSKKIKQKKVKNKKDVVHQPAVEVQNNRKSTLSKNSEVSEEESKKKKKKIGFFSKMLKGKKTECQEDRAETVEERKSIECDENGAFEKPTLSGYGLLNENLKEASLEERKPNLKIAKLHLGSKFIPIDDAELQRKLESRIKRIESEQSSSTEMNISSYLNRNLSVGTPSVKDDTVNKMAISVVHDDSSGEDKPSSPRPSLPLRLPSRPPPPSPPHDKPSNNSLVVTKRLGENFLQANDAVENFISPEFTKKRQTSVAKVRNDYDQVNIIGNMSRNICGKSSDSAPNITHSELAIADIEQEFVSQSADAVTIEEGSTVIERDDERKVSINLEGTNDMSANPSVEFAAIQDSICSPSWNSGDLMSNYKHAGSATGHWSPNDSRSAIMTVNSNSLKETSDNAVQKVDELGLLLSELDRINSSPLEKTDSGANQRPVSEEIKRDSYFEEDFMAAYPIRRRRNSDPDYDIPRPHRLPHCHETNVDSDMLANSSTGNQYDYDTMSRQGADSIVIEATCFLGPGMDYSFDGNRYFGLNENDDSLREKNDKIQVMNYMDSLLVRNNTSEKSDVEGESAAFSKNSNTNLDGYYNANSEGKINKRNIIPLEELDTDERPLQKYSRRANENYQEATEDIEEKVLLRVQNVDKVCRSERSREVYESDLDDFLKLNESMEELYISRTLNKEEFINISNPENESLLPQTVTDDGLKEEDSISNLEESKKDECTLTEFVYDGKGATGLPEDVADSMTNTNLMEEHSCEASSNLSCKNRDLHGDHGDFNAGDDEVLLRQTHRSEHDESARREHRTLRLSFATTETLIVEEEVLVATLKTTTTTTSTDDTLSPDNIEKQKVEQLVDEVVLDMERISDNHFGSMQIQSCVQT